MINENLFNKEWTKIWTTEYSLFSVWLFGREYTQDCRRELGFGFDDIIFHFEKGLATVYRDNRKQNEFAEFLAGRILLDENFRTDGIKKHLLLDEEINKCMALEAKEAIRYDNLRKFIDLHHDYTPFFLLPLWAPNELDKIEAPNELKKEVFEICEKTRKSTEHTYPRMEKFIKKIYALISEDQNIPADLLQALLPEELLDYSRSGVLPEIETLKDRFDYCVLIADMKENRSITGADAQALIDRISTSPAANTEVLHGIVANKGRVKGSVRIVFTEKDMRNFQKGEILVTTMTRPEWLPIMKIAAGFVTDAGGILSHAAIVAREMDKPCVIGTKIATQVLKDGDLVEVDAERGVVRKVKL